MHIRIGYEIELICPQDTPVITMLDVHPERRMDVTSMSGPRLVSLTLAAEELPSTTYQDRFGNICRRFVAPAGRVSMSALGTIHDSGFADDAAPDARAIPVAQLPDEVMEFTLGSRYCETDLLSERAWSLFGAQPLGWRTVAAICDHVHGLLRFDYNQARSTRSAAQALDDGVGVCRDFAHLAITFCRCMNIPARYCTGYLGDIGVPPDPAPIDFSAWFEAYLEGRWWTFDARHNQPRIGRIVIARGRDATDVPIVYSFGPHGLGAFKVVTEEVSGQRFPASAEDRRNHWWLMSAIGSAPPQ